jgi:hypothetical protein
MVELESCDSVATKDLVESMKEYARNFGLQQQLNLDQQSFVSVKVCELRSCATFLGERVSELSPVRSTTSRLRFEEPDDCSCFAPLGAIQGMDLGGILHDLLYAGHTE